jgi:aminoglycoside phosphotransferase (APT) family kinase protein
MPVTTTLPVEMRTWIEDTTHTTVTAATRQAGGGRNEGWLVELNGDRGEQRLFLRWDRSDPAATGDPWTVRREAEVYRALDASAVPTARFVALHPTEQALLLGVVEGDGRFAMVHDPERATAIARDFMLRLADLHGLDAVELGLCGPGESIGDHVHRQLDEMTALIAFRGGVPTAELSIALRWLRANVPAYDGRPVIVQGDTGPGNFMFNGDHVAAIVDWELAHPGDPMDDLAWVSLRSTQEPFPDLPERFHEYEEATGTRIDLDRIRYYRVLAEAKIATMGHGRGGEPRTAGSGDDVDADNGDGADDGVAGGGDVGAQLIFGQLHRRLLVESLSAAMRVELDVSPAETGQDDHQGSADDPTHDWHGLYGVALEQLRDVIVPRIEDGFALQRTKGLARLIRYLEAVDLHGRAFARAELADLESVLGAPVATIGAGRRELSIGVRDGTIGEVDALRIIGRRVARDEELLRASSGALAGRHYDPLTRFERAD